jgi:hypothetical protein
MKLISAVRNLAAAKVWFVFRHERLTVPRVAAEVAAAKTGGQTFPELSN